MPPARLLPSLSVLLLAVSGCATLPPAPGAATIPAECTTLVAALDAAAPGSPSTPRAVPGWPGLAADRFLAGFDPATLPAPAIDAWRQRLAGAGREREALQRARLPDASPAPLAPVATLAARLDACRAASLAAAEAPAALARLHAAAQVPSDYSTVARVLGLWPLSVLPVQALGARYRQETLARLADPPPPLASAQRFGPLPAPPQAVGRLRRDALDVPVPTAAQLDALFALHAPVFEIDGRTDADLPGRPLRRADGRLDFRPEPRVYQWPSLSRLHGRPVLQLNWLIWFAARPPAAGALYAGRLDGLIWRVTLDADGRPYVYDSIHACGCYHLLFPRAGLRLTAAAAALAETPIAPYPAPAFRPGRHLRLRIASATHYLIALDEDDGRPFVPYRSVDYTALYTDTDTDADADAGTQTLFDPDGLIPGSERPERWLLWPMGVASAGAMRERGRHAIAFVGERHFDDPGLPADWLEESPP